MHVQRLRCAWHTPSQREEHVEDHGTRCGIEICTGVVNFFDMTWRDYKVSYTYIQLSLKYVLSYSACEFLKYFQSHLFLWSPGRRKTVSKSLWIQWWARVVSCAHWWKTWRASIPTLTQQSVALNFCGSCGSRFAPRFGIHKTPHVRQPGPIHHLCRGPSSSWRHRSPTSIRSLTNVKRFGQGVRLKDSSLKSFLSTTHSCKHGCEHAQFNRNSFAWVILIGVLSYDDI